MTSLSLDTLRQVTGVFIAESDFQVIELEYKDYLKENQYNDNESVAEQFIDEWKAEQETIGTFAKTTDGFTYFCMDGADIEHPISTKELIENMDMTSYHWENMCRRDWEIFKDIANENKTNLQLINNILNGEVSISHEQIHQLSSAMKGKMEELSQ